MTSANVSSVPVAKAQGRRCLDQDRDHAGRSRERGRALPAPQLFVPAANEDPLTTIYYT